MANHPKLAVANQSLKSILANHTYVANSGPFKGLCHAFGYDPSKYPESRYYQQLVLRMRYEVYSTIKERLWKHIGATSSFKHIDLDRYVVYDRPASGQSMASTRPDDDNDFVTFSIFGTYCRQQFSIQICSMTDEDCFDFASTLKRLPEIDASTGWFTAHSLNRLREVVMRTLFQRVKKFTSAPAVFSTDQIPVTVIDVRKATASCTTTDAAISNTSVPSSAPSTSSSTGNVSGGGQDAARASIRPGSGDGVDVMDGVDDDELWAFSWHARYLAIPDNVLSPAEIMRESHLASLRQNSEQIDEKVAIHDAKRRKQKRIASRVRDFAQAPAGRADVTRGGETNMSMVSSMY
jgi:hypothetical protein